MKPNYFYLLCVLLFTISGCATRQTPVAVIESSSHQQRLAEFNQWQLSGRLAFKSTEEKFSASLNWKQQQQNYEVNLTTFIGTSLLEMKGSPNAVTIVADDKTYHGRQGTALIKRITGWNIPVHKLPLWVKGQFDEKENPTFDERGLVEQLETACQGCDNWKIRFDKYRQFEQVWLPYQITLTNQTIPDNQIKIRINKWNKS